MNNNIFRIKEFVNEPVLSYLPGSVEREELEKEIANMRKQAIDIPLIIGGKEIRTNNTKSCVIPFEKDTIIANYHLAGEKEIKMAIDSAMQAKEIWQNMSYDKRMKIFLKAGMLAKTSWRQKLNASTMLCQAKTFHQAEIDAACELTDFFNANAKALSDIYASQPLQSEDSINMIDYRPLDGFIYAVSPFNFTSIASNLCTAPAMAGNTVVWKPASSAVYSAYVVYQLLKEAGLPDGVINFIPGKASQITDIVLSNKNFAGCHFTGSTKTFKEIWKKVGQNIDVYNSYPRLVGETGGKNFCFVHEEAKVDVVVANVIRAAFEYQGQKCSATSRMYIPKSLSKEILEKLISEVSTIRVGSAEDRKNLLSAVIDKKAFDKITHYIDLADTARDAKIIKGGTYDDSKGYFIEPTIILTENPDFITMKEEIFGPVLTIYIYENDSYLDTLKECRDSSTYALTGSIFSQNRAVLIEAESILRASAGNFYLNDKSTGAVVGQSPFGGGKNSGTNDKAGSIINMYKWVNPRSIKDCLNPISDYRYENMK